MGYHQPDRGKILLDGIEHAISSPRDAYGLGIGMVYQQFFAGTKHDCCREPAAAAAGSPGGHRLAVGNRSKCSDFSPECRSRIDLGSLAASLSAGEKQKVEILKQLFLGSRILILDEPTSVLTPDETDELLGLLRDMAASRKISVLMITHKMREVMSFAREVTILRHGRSDRWRCGLGSVGRRHDQNDDRQLKS